MEVEEIQTHLLFYVPSLNKMRKDNPYYDFCWVFRIYVLNEKTMTGELRIPCSKQKRSKTQKNGFVMDVENIYYSRIFLAYSS